MKTVPVPVARLREFRRLFVEELASIEDGFCYVGTKQLADNTPFDIRRVHSALKQAIALIDKWLPAAKKKGGKK